MSRDVIPTQGPLIEQGADCGYAVRRNGILLLRTATETEVWAMGNGLVLLFDVDPNMINWERNEPGIRQLWAAMVATSGESLEVVPCRAVDRETRS